MMAALVLLSVLTWIVIFTAYEQEPRARQLSQLIVSIVNLTRTALITARSDARPGLLWELSDLERIHIYPAEIDDRVQPLPDLPFLQRVQSLTQEQLGRETQMTLNINGEEALFVSFRIDDDDYWVALPRDRIERHFPLQWLGWGAGALLLSLAGAWLIMYWVTRPLKALQRAAESIGRGQRPPPVAEQAPEEIATLAKSFNRMSADLARLDEDRALILAGVSHDLRTPLTRLRLGIELSASDQASCDAMIADIEEMDKTIGQFLDFARAETGEPLQEIDLVAILNDLAEHYRRRGIAIDTVLMPIPPQSGRPQALRRAVGNLLDNALRYAGDEQPIELVLSQTPTTVAIEIRDRGPGIPAEHAQRLKLPFTRLDNSRSNALGAGLGLAIVDRVARSHRGQLELLPRPGGGLIARITLARS